MSVDDGAEAVELRRLLKEKTEHSLRVAMELELARRTSRELQERLEQRTGQPKHVYIAHPLGAGHDREDNLRMAAQWVAWAADQGVIPVATWVTLASIWPESEARRAQGLAVDLAQIARCDELWLVGPRISPGMKLEALRATELGIPVVDITGRSLDGT